ANKKAPAITEAYIVAGYRSGAISKSDRGIRLWSCLCELLRTAGTCRLRNTPRTLSYWRRESIKENPAEARFFLILVTSQA
ncbi:hypothetical protein, partial [Citrobacter koseri]|uniref:hypothetical protein n=1 Tax=Citrobacter koseri TaxID=545 RepID=UPI001BDD7819